MLLYEGAKIQIRRAGNASGVVLFSGWSDLCPAFVYLSFRFLFVFSAFVILDTLYPSRALVRCQIFDWLISSLVFLKSLVRLCFRYGSTCRDGLSLCSLRWLVCVLRTTPFRSGLVVYYTSSMPV